MDFLWTPWRYTYVSRSDGANRGAEGCVFCRVLAAGVADRESLIVHRGTRNFVMLNRFPYTSGHMMVVPYAHVATLGEALPAALAEMMHLTRQVERLLRALYQPDGINIGMNIGRAAGAGVDGHIHMHALPRWFGDSNFATVIGETRVLPEELSLTWERTRNAFLRASA